MQSTTAYPGFGCGDFQLKAKDGTIMCGRSMEFLMRQESQLITFNRGDKFESVAPDGTKGLEWTNKYGFTGMNAFHLNRVDEGMNEAGLSFGVLTLEETVYQTVPNGEESKALGCMDIGNWILGNFANISEVKEAIQNVYIWGQEIKALHSIMGLHVALHDAEGNNAVIEIINGALKFHNNPNGVLTNDPQFQAQLNNYETNFRSYTPDQAGKSYSLPGDWSSMSRFARINIMSKFAMPETKEAAFNAATHILNATDLPTGVATKKVAKLNLPVTTLWGSIKDLTNRVLYFRSHTDMTFRAIDLTKLNFDKGTVHPRFNVQAEKPTIIDITQQLDPNKNWYYDPIAVFQYSEMKKVGIIDYAKDDFVFKAKEEVKEEALAGK